MPIYVYQVINRNGKGGRIFEVLQGIHEPPLKKDPQSGRPVRRLITRPNLPQNRFDKAVKKYAKSDKHLARLYDR